MLVFLLMSKIICIFASVNQQVDIEKYLEEFHSEISRQHKTIKDLTDYVARLNRRVEALNVDNNAGKTGADWDSAPEQTGTLLMLQS